MTYSQNGQGQYDQPKEINFQMKIGNNVIPDYPIVSQSEFYSQLKKALGIHTSSWHALDIYPSGISSYNTNRFKLVLILSVAWVLHLQVLKQKQEP